MGMRLKQNTEDSMIKNHTKRQLETMLLILMMLLLIFVSHKEEEQEQVLGGKILMQEIFEVRDKETNLILDEYHIDEYNSFLDKYEEDYKHNRIEVIVMYSHDNYNKTVTDELNRNGLSYNYLFIEDCY